MNAHLRSLSFRLPFFIFLLMGLTTVSARAEGTEYFVGYRVIRTSPQEFVKAIRMPDTNTVGDSDKSRLTKYFQIRHKQVLQNNVSFEVVPDLPFFKEHYDSKSPLIFSVSDRELKNEHIELSVIMTGLGGQQLHGRVEVKPHELGSELKFFVTNESYPEALVKVFVSSFKILKITFDDPQEASAQTVKELK